MSRRYADKKVFDLVWKTWRLAEKLGLFPYDVKQLEVHNYLMNRVNAFVQNYKRLYADEYTLTPAAYFAQTRKKHDDANKTEV